MNDSEFLAKIDPIYEKFQRRLLRDIEAQAPVLPSELREQLIGLTMANAEKRADDFRFEVEWAFEDEDEWDEE